MSLSRVCPACGDDEIWRVHRRRALERFISVFGFLPFACGRCRRRFYLNQYGFMAISSALLLWLLSAIVLGGLGWHLLDNSAR